MWRQANGARGCLRGPRSRPRDFEPDPSREIAPALQVMASENRVQVQEGPKRTVKTRRMESPGQTDRYNPGVTMTARTRRGDETRRQILEAARDLFHKQGVVATSPDQVIEASGTGKGQFYHYFKNKE